MIQVSVNYLAVFVSAVASMIFGSLWYSPMLFGKIWAKLAGVNMDKNKMTKEKKKSMMYSYLGMFVGLLLTAYVFANILKFSQSSSISDALQAGFYVWLGFILPLTAGASFWEGKSYKVLLINNGYQLISILLMSVILTLWI